MVVDNQLINAIRGIPKPPTPRKEKEMNKWEIEESKIELLKNEFKVLKRQTQLLIQNSTTHSAHEFIPRLMIPFGGPCAQYHYLQ